MNKDAFNIYEMTNDREKKLWSNCIFIFDSSALLDFYIIPTNTRLNIFETIFNPNKSRLWIPAHVEYEYLKNRKKVINKLVTEKYEPIKEQVLGSINKALNLMEVQTGDLLNKIKNKDAHPHFDDVEVVAYSEKIKQFKIDTKDFNDAIDNRITTVKNEITELLNNDDVLIAFENYFAVGDDFSYEEIYNITLEGKHRYEHFIPPGYKDLDDKEKKGIQIFGDLILWKQILQYGKEHKKPIVFICNDLKEDWCYIDKSATEKRVSAPREELIREIHDVSDSEFWMYNLAQFLYLTNNYLGTEIQEKDIQNIADVINSRERRKSYLELNLVWISSQRSPNGFSHKNPKTIDEDGREVVLIGGVNTPIIHWELYWNFDLILVNNSSQSAINIKIESIGEAHFYLLEQLNAINNLKPYDQIKIKASFRQSVEDVYTVADDIIAKKIPANLEGLKLKVSYSDEDRYEYVTIFEIQNNQTINSFK